MINAIKAVKAPRTVALRMPMLAVSGVLAGLFMTFPTYIGAVLQWLVYIPAAWVLFSLAQIHTAHAVCICAHTGTAFSFLWLNIW